MRILSVAAAALAVASPTVIATIKNDLSFAKNVLREETKTRRLEARRDLETVPVPENQHPHFLNQHRRFGTTALQESSSSVPLQEASNQQQNCDAAFLDCLPDDKCVMCFVSLQTEGIDWASVKPDTPCSDVVNFLFDKNHCASLKGDQASIDTFCKTFDSCVVWDDKKEKKKEDEIDCDSLTSCNWDGMHSSFIGDGICHDALPGCYNHKICDYDGGDCCDDTCMSKDKLNYVDCGSEGYKCRDTASANCNSDLTKECENKSDQKDKKKEPAIKCGPDQSAFRIEMFDSFGDGWDQTVLAIAPKDQPNKVVFKEGLEDGSKGTKFVCLNSASTCYHVDVQGGTWGNEVSWEIHPMKQGSPSIADGGAPMNCEFSVGGEVCLRTCEGKPDSTDLDPEYKSYKSMYNCIDKKCVIQMGACKADKECEPCLAESTPAICYANDNFNALVDCGLCHCLDEEAEEDSEFCEKEIRYNDDVMDFGDDDFANDEVISCSAAETLKGTSAVMEFSECADMDQLGMMITDFDESNFGTLDDFEKCSHEFQNNNAHGGHKAMDCMTILHNAIENPTSKKYNAPTEAISALAKHLYHDAESFCDCAKRASDGCPMCSNFLHFKTLLWESLDACQALDEIDCDAWNEFYEPCKVNVVKEFGSVDFRRKEQCDYVQDDCGKAGLFPAFRKLDCGREIPSAAWDFYNTYRNNCVKGRDNSNSGGSPPVVPSPTAGPKPNPPAPSQPNPPAPSNPKPSPVHPSDNNSNSNAGESSKPYVPKEEKSKTYKSKESKKGKHPFLKFLFFVAICAGGYYIWKKRSSAFEFVQYRRGGAYPQDTEMYSSLSMETGSSSFEPPTLPPTPMETMT